MELSEYAVPRENASDDKSKISGMIRSLIRCPHVRIFSLSPAVHFAFATGRHRYKRSAMLNVMSHIGGESICPRK